MLKRAITNKGLRRSSQRQLQRNRLLSSVGKWMEAICARPPVLSIDYLDHERAAHLQRTLPTRQVDHRGQSSSDIVPKGHHLIYFQPKNYLSELGIDGSSTEYNAPEPYTRRMWAGGSMSWRVGPGSTALRLGTKVTEAVSVPRAEVKNGMMFIHQQRDLYPEETQALPLHTNTDNWCVREIRTHVFRQDEAVKKASTKLRSVKEIETPPPDYSFAYTPTSPLLFRYSALTFNGHKIHYDLDWTRRVEGHPNLVVHGPLTATLLIELAERAALDTAGHLSHFDYRATSPMYVDREIVLGAAWTEGEKERVLQLWAMQEGIEGMRATALII